MKARLIENDNFDKDALFPVVCESVGYVQFIDIEAINELAKNVDIHVFIDINPGKLMDSVIPLAYTSIDIDADVKEKIIDAFVVGDGRTFEQDPRYGFVVLCEIALKALSPAVNDPGTAIDILRVYLSAIRLWVNCFKATGEDGDAKEIKYDSVSIASLQEEDILEDMYSALISDAAENLHISRHIKKSLESIAKFENKKLRKEAEYWQDYLKISCSNTLSENDCRLLFGEGAN